MKDRRPYKSQEVQKAAREYKANYTAQQFLGLCEHLGLNHPTRPSMYETDYYDDDNWQARQRAAKAAKQAKERHQLMLDAIGTDDYAKLVEIQRYSLAHHTSMTDAIQHFVLHLEDNLHITTLYQRSRGRKYAASMAKTGKIPQGRKYAKAKAKAGKTPQGLGWPEQSPYEKLLRRGYVAEYHFKTGAAMDYGRYPDDLIPAMIRIANEISPAMGEWALWYFDPRASAYREHGADDDNFASSLGRAAQYAFNYGLEAAQALPPPEALPSWANGLYNTKESR